MGAAPRKPDRPITVLVVDDNPDVGSALGRWFMFSEDFVWAGWLPGPDGLEAALAKLRVDVVLVDWDMPGVDTGALLKRVAAAYPTIIFAVLSGQLEARAIRAALTSGACGYLGKDLPPAELAAHVRLLAEGRVVLSREALQAIRAEGGT